MQRKLSPQTTYLLVLIGLAVVFLVFGTKIAKDNSPAVKTDTSHSSETAVQPENSASSNDSKDKELTADQQSFAQGLKSLETKDYEQALKYFSQAIAENPDVASYYSFKSEAEMLLGKQTEAKQTIEQGIVKNPDSEILHSKLDVLNSSLNSGDQDTPRL